MRAVLSRVTIGDGSWAIIRSGWLSNSMDIRKDEEKRTSSYCFSDDHPDSMHMHYSDAHESYVIYGKYKTKESRTENIGPLTSTLDFL